jgi:hypothetical protein
MVVHAVTSAAQELKAGGAPQFKASLSDTAGPRLKVRAGGKT